MQDIETMQIMQTMQNVPIYAGYRNHANHANHAGGHEQRPLTAAETGSCEWQRSRGAACGRSSRGRAGAAVQICKRTACVKQIWVTAIRSSAPVFASGHRPAPRKSAKRKRGYVMVSTASMCFDRLALRWARGGGRGFRLPLPTPSGLPTLPQRPGRSPGPKTQKVAPGVWLKKLFTARQRYCASLFPGSSHSARPADETAE